MINAGRDFRTVAVKRFAGIKRAAADFVIAVGKTAAGQAEAKIGIRPQAVDKTQFGIEVHRCERQSQGEVGAQKIRLVVIIKGVTGKRRMAFERLIIAELNQVALDRVNLGKNETRGKQGYP